ncbi:MAG: class I SAM-dependent methyltransferase [Leifsonia sp.]
MQLIVGSTGQIVTVSPMRVRLCPPSDLLVLTRSSSLAHASDAIRQGNVLTADGERFLEKHGLLPRLFDDARFADVYPAELTRFESQFIARALAGSSTGGAVLDVGCGVGRLLVPLRQLGMQVDGVDVSISAIRSLAGRFDGHESLPRLYTADIATFTIHHGYTAAFSAMNSIRYLGTRARCVSHLRAMSLSLKRDAPYLVNMSFPTPKRSSGRTTWRAHATEYSWADGFVDPLESTRDERVTVLDEATGTMLEEVQLLFSPSFAEFLSIVDTTGWQCAHVFDAAGEPFDPSAEPCSGDGGSRWLLLLNRGPRQTNDSGES